MEFFIKSDGELVRRRTHYSMLFGAVQWVFMSKVRVDSLASAIKIAEHERYKSPDASVEIICGEDYVIWRNGSIL